MDSGSQHSEVCSDDERPLNESESQTHQEADGSLHDRSPSTKIKAPPKRREPHSRYNLRSNNATTEPKWVFPERREEASENEEFHDSVQGHPSDVEGEDSEVDFPVITDERRRRRDDPSNAVDEPGDYRDAQAPKTGLGRRRGPRCKNLESEDGSPQQAAARTTGRQSSFNGAQCGADRRSTRKDGSGDQERSRASCSLTPRGR